MSDVRAETTEEKLDSLIKSSDDLRTQAERLILSHKEYRRRRNVDQVLLGLLVAMMAVLAFNSFVAQSNATKAKLIAQQTRANTVQLQRVAAQNKANGLRIVDCTTPEGACSKEMSARTQQGFIGQPVGPINTVVIAAVACAQDVRGDAAIRACVVAKLQPTRGSR